MHSVNDNQYNLKQTTHSLHRNYLRLVPKWTRRSYNCPCKCCMIVKINYFAFPTMSMYSNWLDSDPMAMIYHCGTLFVSFRPDLCTICHHLAKINVHVYSVLAIWQKKENSKRSHTCANGGGRERGLALPFSAPHHTHHNRIHSEATFYKIQLN